MAFDKDSPRVKQYLMERDDFSRYFESEEFNQLIEIIRSHDQINQEELLYEIKVISGLPEEKFKNVFETVYHNLESRAVKDHACEFSKYHIDYKGIRFHLMIGQGSAYWTTKEG